MKEILLPDNRPRRLVFYLAMEEWVSANLGEGFFVWQVAPTVIFGRNQDLESEVNVQYCREHGIDFFRRKSGGGCVYSDEGNLMLSYVTPTTNVAQAFSDYLERLCGALRRMGFDAVSSEHNDVLVGGRKVSGNAFFMDGDSGIVHGTLLYDADFDVLDKAITPSREKLSRHAVQSVRQRVVNLRQIRPEVTLDGVRSFLRDCFSDGSHMLTPQDVSAIENIENTYLDPDFLFGKDARKV